MPIYMKIEGIKGDVVEMGHSGQEAVIQDLVLIGPPPQQIGLLLPAVQKVREAASRTGAAMGAAGDLAASPGTQAILIGLLLPAVQKVREAAQRSNAIGGITGGNQTTGLLLPAVQKVREAAARMNNHEASLRSGATGNSAGAMAILIGSAAPFGKLSQMRNTIGSALLRSNSGGVNLKGAVVFDVTQKNGGTQVILGFGGSSPA